MDPLTIGLTLAAKYAPDIIKYFSDSETAGEVAGKVIDIAKTVTGKDGPGEAMVALREDPALALQFRQAVMANETELERLYLADRADARARDVAMVQAGRYNWRADVLAILAVGGLVLCMWFVARDAGMPERSVNAIMFVAGVLASAVRDVFSYEFGSSRGSKEKDEAIKRFRL